MDVRLVIKQRLEELGLEQCDLAAAARVTESYISQLLTCKKAPPSADRTELYNRINAFLKLPEGKLSEMAEAQRKEELKREIADPPAPLFKEVRELVLRKCEAKRRAQIREIFERQPFGELERLVTQKLLDVAKGIARDELGNERWLRIVAELLGRSYTEMRESILEFLEMDIFNISAAQCAAFLDPLVERWDIDLKTFAMEIVLNRRLASTQLVKFHFAEVKLAERADEEPGFREFLNNAAMNVDATHDEIEFLRNLRFKHARPTALYYYRELQNLRDPLHFQGRFAATSGTAKRRDAGRAEKLVQFESRRAAIQRWTEKGTNPRNRAKSKQSTKPGAGRTDIN
jgi:transcriptional regulator with XRE-family HTH domain